MCACSTLRIYLALVEQGTYLYKLFDYNLTNQYISGNTSKGSSHQILFSEMSLPEIEIRIEKLLPTILGRWEKENPSKRQCKVAFVQHKFGVTSPDFVRFLYATHKLQAKISICMQGSRECCLACVRIPELSVLVLWQSDMPPSAA